MSIRTLIRMLSLCVCLILAFYSHSFAQTSSESNQEQSLSNNQDIVSGNQTVNLPSSTPIRSFPYPGSSPFPSSFAIPSHFAPPVTDGNFGNIIKILEYKNSYTIDDAEALMQKHGKIRVLTSCYIPERLRTPTTRLHIVPEPKDKVRFKKFYEPIGIGNYKAMDSSSISEHILGTSIKEGMKIGADLMIFQEGAALVQVAKGYSIGLFNSFSFSNSAERPEGHGNVTVGGIGVGKGESGYNSRPWLRVQFFKKIAVSANDMKNQNFHVPDTKEEKIINDFEESLEKAREPTLEEKYWDTID